MTRQLPAPWTSAPGPVVHAGVPNLSAENWAGLRLAMHPPTPARQKHFHAWRHGSRYSYQWIVEHLQDKSPFFVQHDLRPRSSLLGKPRRAGLVEACAAAASTSINTEPSFGPHAPMLPCSHACPKAQLRLQAHTRQRYMPSSCLAQILPAHAASSGLM
ncbi:hypothetical protein PG990_005275 [Apiospora arundinis]